MNDEKDRQIDDLEDRLSKLLWYITDGNLSKPYYSLETMKQEVDSCIMREVEKVQTEYEKRIDLLLEYISCEQWYVEVRNFISYMISNDYSGLNNNGSTEAIDISEYAYNKYYEIGQRLIELGYLEEY